jgi:hypothetical protein
VVQLSDSTSTTSSTLASTPTATKAAYDLADGAIAKSLVTTAGDIIYRNGSAPVRLGIGTAGQVLAVNSGATAPEWATPAGGGGKVLQVVNATTSTVTSNSTTTYADTTLTATITPTLATSKILVLIAQQVSKNSTNSGNAVNVATFRGATQILEHLDIGYTGTAIFNVDMYTINYLDSPATTSATTYKTQFRNTVASASVAVQPNSSISSITLMEIGV